MKADCASQGDGLGGSLPEVGAGGAEEVVTTAWRGEMLKGGRVDTPGWPWRRQCRSHRGPLATRVNTDDFSV